MPPSLREWLAESHLAWFVLDAVEAFDLGPFYASYRQDGWGRAARDPVMMLALLLYAYAAGKRSSRRIERRCEDDVAFRVITANRVPDHTTIARFRVRHERAIAGLFADVLRLCGDAGLVRVEVIAVDGTKVHANASHHATRDYAQRAGAGDDHAMQRRVDLAIAALVEPVALRVARAGWDRRHAGGAGELGRR